MLALRLLVLALLMIGGASAQSTPTGVPANNPDTDDTDDLRAFMVALEQLTGTDGAAKDQLSYTFRFTEIYDSNPLQALRRPKSDWINNFGGDVALSKNWQRTAITANYTAGSDYYGNFDGRNNSYHEFNGAESFTFGRTKLLLGGDYEFLPESSFGFDATHLLPGASYTLINPELIPNQSIQTRLLDRSSYTSVVQLGLKIDDRSSLDFSGSYGRLRYRKDGIPGTNQASAGTGYSFVLSSRDNIGLAYQYGLFETSHNPLQIRDSVVSGWYAHRFRENLIVKLGAGPDLRTYTGTKSKLLRGIDPSLAANAELDYSTATTHLSTGYIRSTVSGQGVLQGSESDEVQLAGSQWLGHGFTLSASFGYARSTSLAKVVKTTSFVDQVFNSEFASIGLNKRMGSLVTLLFGYTVQNQESTAPVCAGGLCQAFPQHHVITFGFTFSPKPLNLSRN